MRNNISFGRYIVKRDMYMFFGDVLRNAVCVYLHMYIYINPSSSTHLMIVIVLKICVTLYIYFCLEKMSIFKNNMFNETQYYVKSGGDHTTYTHCLLFSIRII